MPSVNPQQPITWVSTDVNANAANRHRQFRDEKGNLRIEKHPQIGHVGTHEEYQMGRPWYRRFVTHNGDVIFYCLTNGSSAWNIGSDYGQDRMRKARFHGWFTPGECPCALVASGQIGPERMLVAANRTSAPCPANSYSFEKPCPHAVVEIEARRAETKRRNDEREEAFREQDQAAQATREQTKALIEAMGENQQNQLMAMLQAMKGELPEAPVDEKKKK